MVRGPQFDNFSGRLSVFLSYQREIVLKQLDKSSTFSPANVQHYPVHNYYPAHKRELSKSVYKINRSIKENCIMRNFQTCN